MKKTLIKFLPAIGMALVAGLTTLYEEISEQKTDDRIEELKNRISLLEGGRSYEK